MSDVIITARGNNSSSGSMPSGVILLWYGSVDSIPEGWQLCDGTNDTPDLRDRFIVGAGNSYSVGNTGGSNTVKLTTNEMPSHTHTVSNSGIASKLESGYDKYYVWRANNASEHHWSDVKISITLNNTGGGAAHENRPPYYALCYIMKL